MDEVDAAAVAEAFGLGRPVGTPVFAARGAMGEVWRLPTDRGPWAVKALFAWVDAPARPPDVDLQLVAHGAGVPLPLPVLAADGRAVVELAGRRYRAYEWVDLDPPLTMPAPPDRAAEAGALLAALHRLPLASQGDVDPWYTTPATTEELATLGARAVAAGRPWASDFVAVLPVAEDLRRHASKRHGEVRLCHRDVDPSNLVPLAGGGPVVVMDWENCGPLAPDQEVASAMQLWASGASSVRADSARAFLAGYRDAGGDATLDPSSSWSMAVCTAINFLGVMGAQALADDEHREFAEDRLRRMCGGELHQLLVSIDALTPLLDGPGIISG